MPNNKKNRKDIFISYSSLNKEKAFEVRDELVRNGFTYWMDENEIPPAENYAEEIMEGLRATRIVVLVLSKQSQDSIYVLEEIKRAFKMNKEIIAFKIDESFPTGKMAFYLKNKQWIDASAKPKMSDSFPDLIEHADRLCKKVKKEEESFDYKIPLIAIAIILIAVVAFMAFSGNDEVVSETTDSSNISIDFIESVDGASEGEYVYSVVGSVPSELSNSSKDVVHVDFYDDSGKVVKSDESKLSEITGNNLGQVSLNDNDISKVSVELQDSKGNVISSAESSNVYSNNQ